MHITEGVVSLPILVGSGIVTATGVAVGVARLGQERIITTALLSSAFFAASLVHIPVAVGVSLHLLLNGLLGIVLGWACIPAICVALILQSLLFQHGGLTVLGVNGIIMAGPALLVYLFFGKLIALPGKKEKSALF